MRGGSLGRFARRGVGATEVTEHVAVKEALDVAERLDFHGHGPCLLGRGRELLAREWRVESGAVDHSLEPAMARGERLPL